MKEYPFDKIAVPYAANRPNYPSSLYAEIAAYGSQRSYRVAVDLGCGAGQSLIGLKSLAKQVVGIEPSRPMRLQAEQAFGSFAELRDGTGEMTGLASASADLVTVATALHWMDSRLVFDEVHRLLSPGGTLAIYKYGVPIPGGAAGSVFIRHLLVHWRRFRSARLDTPDDTLERLGEHPGFKDCQARFVDFYYECLSPRRLIDFLMTSSWVSGYVRSLRTPTPYLQDLEVEFGRSAEFPVRVDLALSLFLARRA